MHEDEASEESFSEYVISRTNKTESDVEELKDLRVVFSELL